jgi:hypothetical protein
MTKVGAATRAISPKRMAKAVGKRNLGVSGPDTFGTLRLPRDRDIRGSVTTT